MTLTSQLCVCLRGQCHDRCLHRRHFRQSRLVDIRSSAGCRSGPTSAPDGDGKELDYLQFGFPTFPSCLATIVFSIFPLELPTRLRQMRRPLLKAKTSLANGQYTGGASHTLSYHPEQNTSTNTARPGAQIPVLPHTPAPGVPEYLNIVSKNATRQGLESWWAS